jgi:hypothetical protein
MKTIHITLELTNEEAESRYLSRKGLMESIGITKLNKTYGKYGVPVLTKKGFLEQEEQKRGAPRKYKLLKELPSTDEFRKLSNEMYKITIEDLIGNARGTIEELASELRDWHDNLPESLQEGDKGSTLEESASTLEGLDISDLPDWATNADHTTVFFPDLKCESRADRASEASEELRAAAERLREEAQNLEQLKEGATPEENKKRAEQGDELSNLADEYESVADEISGVEFPGMY